MKHILLFLMAGMLLVGCSNRPKDIIDEKKMVEIMADLQITEAYERNGKAGPEINGNNRELLGRGVLMAHGVTVEEMDSTLAWYGKNMDEYSKLYKKVDERLAKMQQKYAIQAGVSESDGPSTDLWPYGRQLVLDPNQLTDGIMVSIPIPDLELGDKLTWKLRTKGSSSRRMILGVDYEDGRMELVENTNNGMDPWMEISLQTDTLNKVDRIFAIMNAEYSTPRAFIDSIQLLHYPFNIEEYHKSGYQRKIAPPSRKAVKLESDSVKPEKPDTPNINTEVPDKSTIKPKMQPAISSEAEPLRVTPKP